MKERWLELFEGGDKNLLSMSRLLPFLSFFPASYVLMKTENETIFGWYVSTFAAMYIGGKSLDIIKKPLIEGKDANISTKSAAVSKK